MRFKIKFNPFRREIVRRKFRYHRNQERKIAIQSNLYTNLYCLVCVQLIINQERNFVFQSKFCCA